MIKILVVALAATLVAGGASAQGATASGEKTGLGDFFSGTLEIDVPAGNWSAKRYLAADHTYRETGADGEVRGTWSIEGGKICTTREKPVDDADHAARYCNTGVGRHAGEMWRDADPVTGNAVFFNLKPGR